MRDLTDEERAGLAAADHLIEYGTPIFIGKPALDDDGDWQPDGGHHGTGYWLPSDWQNTKPDRAVLDAWCPGDALCAVMGYVVDGVDVDPQKGGNLSALNGTRPTSYGRQSTPSGGTHDLIASLGVRSHDGVLPGVDVKAGVGGQGHGFLFIAPTVKLSKVTGEIGAYAWTVTPNLADVALLGDDGSGTALAALVEAVRAGGGDGPAYDGPEYADLTAEQKALADQHVAALIFDLSVRLGEAAGWDETTRDHKDRGWERVATDAAWALMCLALCPWTELDLDTAATEYERILPTVIATNEKCAGKWDAGRIARAEAAPVRLPPWADPIAEIEAGGDSGWAPVDLAATVAGLLDGTITRPEPTIGDFGGGCLFYGGRINSVHGDSTAGKTWTALVTTAQELALGETVVYVDLEDSAEGTVSRLLTDLGVPADAVIERFVYLHPDEPLSKTSALRLAALLAARQPSLVVVDSTGEALAIEGANPNADEEVARWFRLLPRLAIRCGAAVLLLDHATKAGDNDLWPIGSQRKRAAVSGAAYLQKVVVPFGKGQDGKAVLICAKDRHGNYPLRRRVAALAVTGGVIHLRDETGSAAGDFRPTGLMERVSIVLEAATEPLSTRRITDTITGRTVHVRTALDSLVTDGYVKRDKGPNRALLHTSVKPYREADDDLM